MTHSQSLRYTGTEKAHEVNILFAGELCFRRRTFILMFKHEIMADV